MKKYLLAFSCLMILLATNTYTAEKEGKPSKAEIKQLKKEAKEKVKAFNKAIRKAKDAPSQISEIQKLAEIQHKEIMRAIAPWVTKSTEEVRVAAMAEIAKYKNDKDAADLLTNSIRPNFQSKALVIAAFQGIVAIQYKPSVKTLIQYMNHKEKEIAIAAIESIGKMKIPESVPSLIHALKEMEGIEKQITQYKEQNPQGVVIDPNDPSASNIQLLEQEKMDMLEKRQRALEPPIREALTSITGETLADTITWEKWWRKNKNELLKQK